MKTLTRCECDRCNVSWALELCQSAQTTGASKGVAFVFIAAMLMIGIVVSPESLVMPAIIKHLLASVLGAPIFTMLVRGGKYKIRKFTISEVRRCTE